MLRFKQKKYNRQESHNLFNNTFPNGFAFEVLKVFSPPPKVGFSWRHWGQFSGKRSWQKLPVQNIHSGAISQDDLEWPHCRNIQRKSRWWPNDKCLWICHCKSQRKIANRKYWRPGYYFVSIYSQVITAYLQQKYIRDEVYYDQAEFMKELLPKAVDLTVDLKEKLQETQIEKKVKS